MTNVEQTIISQYANSPTILQLVQDIDSYLDPAADIDNFYDVVWNVDTAVGFGLDIWGRIVGLPTGRYIYTSPVTVLDDDQFRTLILLKALSNISITSAPSFNRLLRSWFGDRGRAYVNDLGSMSMRYTFEFQLEDFEVQILANPEIFLRPAGVLVTIRQFTAPVFGFSEAHDPLYTPFNVAPFVTEVQV